MSEALMTIGPNVKKVIFRNCTGRDVKVCMTCSKEGIIVPPGKSHICLCNATIWCVFSSSSMLGLQLSIPDRNVTYLKDDPIAGTASNVVERVWLVDTHRLVWGQCPWTDLLVRTPNNFLRKLSVEVQWDIAVLQPSFPTCCCNRYIRESIITAETVPIARVAPTSTVTSTATSADSQQ